VNLTLENLNAKGACATGLEWITPILGDADVWDRLVTEHPEWAQWAVGKGFTHEISEPVWARMGCVLAGSQLVFAQTAGDYSTQTAGYESTQTAGYESTQTAGDYSTQTAGGGSRHKAGVGSVFVCRYYKDGWQVAVTINPDPNFYWTYDIERGEWVHAEDQSETQVAGS